MRYLVVSFLLFTLTPLAAQESIWEQVYSTGFGNALVTLADGTVLAGMRHGSYNERVFRSDDDGLTWSPSPDGIASFNLAVFPDGAVLGAGASGVYRSEDAGQTWTRVRPPLNNDDFCTFNSWWTLVAAVPDGSALIGGVSSAGFPSRPTSQARGTELGCQFHGAVQSSSNGIAPWSPLSSGLVAPVAFAATPEGTLWTAGSMYGIGPRLRRSSDGGLSWETVADLDFYVRALLATETGTLLAGAGYAVQANAASQPIGGGSVGLFRSEDGLTWNASGESLSTLSVPALIADGQGFLYAGTSGGVFRSLDDGLTWETLNTGLPADAIVTALAITPNGHLIAGLHDAGLYRTTEAFAVSDEDEASPMSVPILHGAYPNPFSASTMLTFELPAASDVTLRVYDVLGREVATVARGAHAAGTHRVTWTPDGLPSGLYVARLQVGHTIHTRRLILAR